MEDLQTLSKQILARTKEEGQTKLDDYKKVADEKIEETRQKLLESEKSRKESIELELNNDYERQVQTLANQQRNNILAKKQTLLNSIFDQAVKEMEKWDQSQFTNFLTGVLSRLDQSKQWTLVPGQASLNLIQTDQIQASIKEYPFVTVSEEVVKGKAGFILQQGGIDYNFCFDVLINELKKEFSPQLATLAF
ncbi:V-type ATP synthase subunit E [Amphibacillus sp. Q70]|uniref:V-type ATP synthase subunit E n=1 Tax=Amphibacillus sp. Q70 TaxID=3453416 RepID=UPI003F872E38